MFVSIDYLNVSTAEYRSLSVNYCYGNSEWLLQPSDLIRRVKILADSVDFCLNNCVKRTV